MKTLIKKVFKILGYSISRLPYAPKESGALIRMKIGNYKLTLPGDHRLPEFLRNPFYSTNLPRLARRVKGKYDNLVMIDVGANIGDTVALTRSQSDFPIVCIEGSDKYYGLLVENLSQFKNVFSFKYFFGEADSSIQGDVQSGEGTLKINKQNGLASSSPTVQLKTLDTFLKQKPQFRTAKLLKIDTDGYDLKIIKGGLEYIRTAKPIIFFEYDTVYFSEQGDSGISVLEMMEDCGYKDIIYYENGGKLILSAKLSDHLLLRQMDWLIDKNHRTPFPYYDVVLFHEEDADVARQFIADEMLFFYKQKIL